MSTDDNHPAEPAILTDVYGKRAPAAAKFGQGVNDIAGVEQATQARRDQKPGVYNGGGPDDLARQSGDRQ